MTHFVVPEAKTHYFTLASYRMCFNLNHRLSDFSRQLFKIFDEESTLDTMFECMCSAIEIINARFCSSSVPFLL